MLSAPCTANYVKYLMNERSQRSKEEWHVHNIIVCRQGLKNVFSAREFVWWYNGHPDYRNLPVDLSAVHSCSWVNGAETK